VYERIFKNLVQSVIEWAVFHLPHPERVTDKGAMNSMRNFLDNAWIKNDDLQGICCGCGI
jgi:hypothetical protein